MFTKGSILVLQCCIMVSYISKQESLGMEKITNLNFLILKTFSLVPEKALGSLPAI